MARNETSLLVNMTRQEKADLATLAARDGRTMNSLLRWLVEQYKSQPQPTIAL
jgi:hypothetical protein